MFEVKKVVKKYGEEFALNEVSLTLTRGLNFIMGASGSGKTTLLKIITGMEQDFEGEVLYCGKNIQTLNEKEKSYFYNNVFGFVWQDFNLVENLTVLENVMLPQYLKDKTDKKAVLRILNELKISELANQVVSKLSGGQKQRVAIARELVKNPSVIIADEPTSALDGQAAKLTMEILENLAKTKMVIIVTHDVSLITPKAKVYELDKGELISSVNEGNDKVSKIDLNKSHRLSFSNASKLGLMNINSGFLRFASMALSLVIAATLLLVSVSGAISGSGKSAFNELYQSYGKGILDITIVGSFISASGTGDEDEPSADVNQNIDGLYDQYLKDERVEYIVSTQAFHDIVINYQGTDYKIETGSSAPNVNELLAGKMPDGEGNEVVVPNSFIERLGLSLEEAIGKTITFDGSVYDWKTGEPVSKKVSSTVEIVGVVDTTVSYEYNGEIQKFSVDDSFFFSKPVINEMRKQADVGKSESNFTMRAKTPADLIEIKDELNKKGIVPLGQFELVEDMVRLSNQTGEQSGSAMGVIAFLAIVVVGAVSLMNAFNRKREYAIYKVSGYACNQLILLTFAESLFIGLASAAIFLCASPFINMGTSALWNIHILNSQFLFTGAMFVFGLSLMGCLIHAGVSITTQAAKSLIRGNR